MKGSEGCLNLRFPERSGWGENEQCMAVGLLGTKVISVEVVKQQEAKYYLGGCFQGQ